jgi:hypothetical protein
MDGPMTATRLAELRTVLAALADKPIATLEVHPLPEKVDLSRGIPLDAASPLAHHLTDLITESAKSSPVVGTATSSGESLFRMVVPAKVAARVSQGVVRPMASKAVEGGVHSALMGPAGIAAQATFVPVGEAAAAAGGAGVVAGAAAAGGVGLTLAAPLVLMAVAVGASAAAEIERQQAIEHITELLEQLQEQALDDERNELEGCRDAIEKATAILLDEGKLGVSLGLDSAVHEIGKALAAAERRSVRWGDALAGLPNLKAVDIDALTKAFPGIEEEGGKFRAHLELAALAIALKRRVIVLQAVEHAQMDSGNLLENFGRALGGDQQRVDKLEARIADVLVRLSSLELADPAAFDHRWSRRARSTVCCIPPIGSKPWATGLNPVATWMTWSLTLPDTGTDRSWCFQRFQLARSDWTRLLTAGLPIAKPAKAVSAQPLGWATVPVGGRFASV